MMEGRAGTGRGEAARTRGETVKEGKENGCKTIKMRFSLRDTLPLLSLNHLFFLSPLLPSYVLELLYSIY